MSAPRRESLTRRDCVGSDSGCPKSTRVRVHKCTRKSHADATALLLNHGSDPNRQDRKGRTPAHCGCAKGQLETVKLLGTHNANLWLKNARGDLPLHEAAASGRRELVKWLLDQRPSQVNARNNDGRCPLHLAALNDNADMCKIFLDNGAQVNPILRTSKNLLMTPLDCALQRGFRSTAKFLQLHGGVLASRLGTLRIGSEITTNLNNIHIREDITIGSSSETEAEQTRKERPKRRSIRRRVAYSYEKNSDEDAAARGKSAAEKTDSAAKISRAERDMKPNNEISEKHVEELLFQNLDCLKPLQINDNGNIFLEETKSNITVEDSIQSETNKSSTVQTKPKLIRPKSAKRHKQDYADKIITSSSRNIDQNTLSSTENETLIRQETVIEVIKENTSEEKTIRQSEDDDDQIKSKTILVEAAVHMSPDNMDQNEDAGQKENTNNVEYDESATVIELTRDIVENKENSIENYEQVKQESSSLLVTKANTKPILQKGLTFDTDFKENIEKTALERDIKTAEEVKNSLEPMKDESIILQEVPKNEQLLDMNQNINDNQCKILNGEENINDKNISKIDENNESVKENEESYLKLDANFKKSVSESTENTSESLEKKVKSKEIDADQYKIDTESKIEQEESIEHNIKESSRKKNELSSARDSQMNSEKECLNKSNELNIDLSMKNFEQDTETENEMNNVKEERKRKKKKQKKTKTDGSVLDTDDRKILSTDSSDSEQREREHKSFKILEEDIAFQVLNDNSKEARRTRRSRSKKNLQDKSSGTSSPDIEETPKIRSKSSDRRKVESSAETRSVTLPPLSAGKTRSESNLSAPNFEVFTDNEHKSGSNTEVDDVLSSASRKKKLKKRARLRVGSKSAGSDYESSNLIDSGFEPSPRSSRIPKRKVMSERGVNMTSVTQTIQTNIRRYHMERKIFQHLLELKRLQIRSGQANEAVLVKRAIDAYHNSVSATVGAGRYTKKDFSYKSFESFLYHSLRMLQKGSADNLKGLPEYYDNPLLCTQSTHRCLHATHAYTGIPCAAYIPRYNHHTMPKIGFTPRNSTGFLPKIDPKGKSVTLELSHGNDKQVISLPADRLDQNKRYYVTFTVKGQESQSPNTDKNSHRHAKSV